MTLIWGPSESPHTLHAACILNRGSVAPSRTDVNPPLRLHTAHRCGFCVFCSPNCWRKQEKSKYSQAPSTSPRRPLNPGDVGSHRIEGVLEKAGSQLWCKVSLKPYPRPPSPSAPARQNVLSPMDEASGVCSCWLSSVCMKELTGYRKGGGGACEWRRHQREFLSPQWDCCQLLDHGRELVPCVPQMGPLNMRGHHVQMAHSETTEFTDKRPGPEIIPTNVPFLKVRDKNRGRYLRFHLYSSGWISSLMNINKIDSEWCLVLIKTVLECALELPHMQIGGNKFEFIF